MGTRGRAPIGKTDCVACGQCITHCPTGALRERDDTETVFDALADPDKIVVVQIAPAVRSAWGEELGIPREEATVERLACVLRRVGFEYVFDTDFSADLTIMEEGSELLERLGAAAKGEDDSRGWPMFTSCCPGWVRFVKARYPEFVDSLSTSKSPQQMFGAIAKTYYAKVLGVEPERLFVVSVMPCTAKKAECALPSMVGEGGAPDVDVALTVREMVRMIRASHVSVETLAEEPLDTPLGFGTGAGVIFGATGGVMEAAVRSAYYLVTGKNPDADFFTDVRGLDGWKEAVADIDDTKVRVAVAHGLGNAARLLDAIRDSRVSYDFVEAWRARAAASVAAVSPSTTAASWQPSAVRCCGAWMPLRTFASRTRIPMSRRATASSWARRSRRWPRSCCIPIITPGRCLTKGRANDARV